MAEGTLKEDILAALQKERDRLNDLPTHTPEDDERWSLCVEYIKRINQSSEERPAELSVEHPWSAPLRL